MNRETKIGLLVGLGFVIILGILLSDHMTTTAEPAGAPLQVAASTLRSGLGEPAGEARPDAVTPPEVVPTQTVLTRAELAPRLPPVAPAVPTAPNDDSSKEAADAPAGGGVTLAPQRPTVRTIAQTQRTFKVQPGDTLSKIALRMMGSSSRANRTAIINANASLKSNPDRLVVGRTYVLPAAVGEPAGDVESDTRTITSVKTAKPSAPEHIYVVQSGDTLWSIAREQVGDTAAVAALKQLNHDALKGGDRVRVNMKLRLPTRSVAAAE